MCREPSVGVYRHVSGTALGQGWTTDPSAVFKQMDTAGVRPNVCRYSSFISAYDKGGQWQKAEAAFDAGSRGDAQGAVLSPAARTTGTRWLHGRLPPAIRSPCSPYCN